MLIFSIFGWSHWGTMKRIALYPTTIPSSVNPNRTSCLGLEKDQEGGKAGRRAVRACLSGFYRCESPYWPLSIRSGVCLPLGRWYLIGYIRKMPSQHLQNELYLKKQSLITLLNYTIVKSVVKCSSSNTRCFSKGKFIGFHCESGLIHVSLLQPLCIRQLSHAI